MQGVRSLAVQCGKNVFGWDRAGVAVALGHASGPGWSQNLYCDGCCTVAQELLAASEPQCSQKPEGSRVPGAKGAEMGAEFKYSLLLKYGKAAKHPLLIKY